MAYPTQNFRPLTYLQKMSEDEQNVSFLLNVFLTIPNDYMISSSGIQATADENITYLLDVKRKHAAVANAASMGDEAIQNANSINLNWRTADFEISKTAGHHEIGKLTVLVVDSSDSNTEVPKGKSKIYYTDADDTDIKPQT